MTVIDLASRRKPAPAAAAPPRMFIHSCHVKTDRGDAVVVKEHVHQPDGTVVPELSVIRNPRRTFSITKEGQRNHTDKKEAEDVRNVDTITCFNYELDKEVFKALNGYYPRGRVQLRELFNSQYIYGADIAIETLVKARYQKLFAQSGATPHPVTTGFLDMEWSILPGNEGEILVATVTHETQVYTAILESYFFKYDAHGNKVPGDLAELQAFSERTLRPLINETFAKKDFARVQHKNAFTFHYFVGKRPIDLLEWLFARIHENRTDFIGVWNEEADIPMILRTAEEAGVDPADLFCPPELPKELRVAKFIVDTKKDVQHYTRKWHWMHTTAYSQFYDAMCLYSILRTVIGLEGSYSLDWILKKNGVSGKITFPEDEALAHMSKTDWHRHMQTREPYKYIVYNQWDVVSIQLMEWKNNDVQSMYQLSGVSSIAKYTRQTRKAADTLYFDWLERGKVLASVGTTMVSPYDHLIPKVGGAVLRPERMDRAGLCVFSDKPGHRTMLHPMVNDVDFSQMYPTVNQAGNTSKETKLSTFLSIDGRPNDMALFSLLVSPTENAVYIGQTYFGLPGYEQMDHLYAQHKASRALTQRLAA